MKKMSLFLLVCIVSLSFAFGASAEEVQTDKILHYWRFENTASDLSHEEFGFVTEELDPQYEKGVVGNCIELPTYVLMTDPFSNKYDWSTFTFSFWFYWYGGNGFNVLASLGTKGTKTHFELNIEAAADSGPLGFYNEGSVYGSGGMIEKEEWYCITVVDTAEKLTIYLNGEPVITKDYGVSLAGIADAGNNPVSIGGLTDSSLQAHGLYDEVVLANYAFDDELVKQLYTDPQAARAKLTETVQNAYPADYERPADPTATPEPTKNPTPVPTEKTAATPNNSQIPAASDKPGNSDVPKSTGNAMKIVIPVIIGAVIIVAAVVAIILIKRRKK